MRALNQAEKFGMVYFVRDQRLKMEDINEANMSNLASIVGDYINHPGCAGIYGLDEPTTEKFAPLQTLKSSFDALGYNDRSVYINMLPNYAPDSAFGMTNGKRNTYEQYLSTYMQQVKMPYLMYDYYPFVMGSNALDLDKNSRIVPYFENISVARKVANQYSGNLAGDQLCRNSGRRQRLYPFRHRGWFGQYQSMVLLRQKSGNANTSYRRCFNERVQPRHYSHRLACVHGGQRRRGVYQWQLARAEKCRGR